jgi:DNA topoisomerase-1
VEAACNSRYVTEGTEGKMDKKVLVIVESPTKAKTIRKFLPPGFTVEASVGHIRDLPQTAADIPKGLKDKEWARLGIDVENDFAPLYITPKGKAKIVAELKKRVKECDVLYLATDEDREGESISAHLVEVLKPNGKEVHRMVFHEITSRAIREALEHTREIDMNLVQAQEARRVLDRLYGYTLSPLIWKKIAYGLSAGRVQSPGLRLIVQREFERVAFKRSVYWDLVAHLYPEPAERDVFEARLVSIDGKRIASGKDFDPETGSLKASKDLLVLDEERAWRLEQELRTAAWRVADVQEKETVTRPSAPFITSTLQQEANRKLGLSGRDTMRIAQRLYEEGLITYMRTDSPALSTEAIEGSRNAVSSLYGEEYLSPAPRQYAARSRGAQEAHEAIRPAGTAFVHPDEIGFTGKERALYEMIWKRTLASQMADARKLSMTVGIDAGSARFQANGSRILFPGFLRVYVEGSDDPEAALEDREVILPTLAVGQPLGLESLECQGHETKPPARYTEASLIQRLEKEGIGRPSTYAGIIGVLYERDYVRKVGSALVPTYTGVCVAQFLENNFTELVEYSFTSNMEEALDEIAVGTRDRSSFLQSFYLGENGLKARVEARDALIKAEESRTVRLPQLGGITDIKVGRFGPYVVHREDGSEIHASIPEDIPPGDLTREDLFSIIDLQKRGPVPVGTDPDSGLPVYCLTGRFGPYVQLGEVTEDNPKPRRASLPKGVSPSEITLPLALKLLSLPRTLGLHPGTGKEIQANVGRFGPYVVHDGEFRSLKKEDDVYTVTLERALELLSEEKIPRRGSRVIRELGKVPGNGTGKERTVLLCEGKYGPYLKAGTVNIRIPDELKTPESLERLTIEQAASLVSEATGKKKRRA